MTAADDRRPWVLGKVVGALMLGWWLPVVMILLVVDTHTRAIRAAASDPQVLSPGLLHGAVVVAVVLMLAGGYAVLDVFRDVSRSARLAADERSATSSELRMVAALLSRTAASADQQAAELEDLRRRLASANRTLSALESKGRDDPSPPSPSAALTSLPNHELFHERLAQAIIRADRGQHIVALLVVDLDRLGLINESFGYDAGEALLRTSAARIQSCLRKMDTVAAGRLEAATFAVIVEGIPRLPDGDTARPWPEASIAKRLLQALASPHTLHGQDLRATASIGIALYPRDGQDAGTLVMNASLAVSRAKGEGGNTYRYFTAAANARTVERLSLESKLRRALEGNELVLHYQPQVDVREGRLVAVEALLRWSHPELGMVSPADFIPVAEESDLIELVDAWVLARLRDQVGRWQEMGLPPLRLAVNVSARQFGRGALVHTIASFLKETGLDPQHLEIEVTEGTLMQDQASARTILKRLKDLDVKLCVDDFGTGYSSLAYLKHFPVDSLKIDRTFIREVTTDRATAAIVSSIIALGRNLGLGIVAEGVETDEQLRVLQQQGCHLIQGFLFSRALPPDDLVQILRDGGRLLPSTTSGVPAAYQRA